jgi:hypothetical protein
LRTESLSAWALRELSNSSSAPNWIRIMLANTNTVQKIRVSTVAAYFEASFTDRILSASVQ